MKNRNKICLQGGAVLPMVAIGLLAILGIGGMAIDLGHVYLNKTRLQNALDAAALSGARTLMLTNFDTTVADTHARQAFTAHLTGAMSSLDVNALETEFSNRLSPFTPGSNPANFVRIRYQGFQTDFTLSSVLPGVGTSTDIGATAVAGPIPLGGGDTCNLMPISYCPADVTDTDCSDGFCYGVSVGGEVEYVLKSGSAGMGNGMGNGNGGSDPCDPYSGDGSCIEPPSDIGPGNFQALRMGASGGNNYRHNLAGGYGGCLDNSSTVETEPGNMTGPTYQGLNTRFGIYAGPLGGSAATYPPDLVTTHRLDDPDFWYDDYSDAITAALAAGTASTGVPFRRLITVPVLDCNGTGNGQSTIDVEGFACFFLTRPVTPQSGQTSYIYGQLVAGCESSGSPGPSPGTNSPSSGPYKIVLYKDPNSPES